MDPWLSGPGGRATPCPCSPTPVTSAPAPLADVAALATPTGLEQREVEARLGAGKRCYGAHVGTAAAAHGWVAAAGAEIGELDVAFRLGSAERYLWDFRTLPAWRGRGLYPNLLQSIVRQEGQASCWPTGAPEAAPCSCGRAAVRPA
jgi:GNAT superfamily N-acetyltransferase